MKKTTIKQAWHDELIDAAKKMGKERHLGPRRAMILASYWMLRAADRINNGLDPYTGEPK